MIELVMAINDFLDHPALRNKRFIPLFYKGEVFLVNFNAIVHRDYKEVIHVIDDGANSDETIYNYFMISEERFNKKTSTPYPFKYFKEMNKVTGAE